MGIVLAKYLLRIAVLECRFASMHIVYNAPRGWNMDNQHHVGEMVGVVVHTGARANTAVEHEKISTAAISNEAHGNVPK
jgi:hypothetical protein